MAFFKFRLPANASAVTAEAAGAAPGESVEAVRRRARHRLIGAVVLVFVAVVAFPLLFDSQPRPVAVDTPILIPDRQGTAPLSVAAPVPAAQAPAKPLLPSAPSAVPAQASLEPGKEEVVASASAAVQPASAVTGASSAEKVGDKVAEKPVDKPADKAAVAPAAKASQPAAARAEKPAAKNTDDGQKAKALLDGKSADHAVKVVIQVGAFSDADKVRDVRRKLEQAGLKTYTQSVEGKDGKRSTRIRLGPFESRAEADKAAARVRKLDLPANLITL